MTIYLFQLVVTFLYTNNLQQEQLQNMMFLLTKVVQYI